MIDVDGVRVTFGDVEVLDGVDLTVDREEFVGLVGPNGVGKTTLLRTINGILAPDDGTVRLGGDPVETLSARAVGRRVATVPQDTAIGFAFTAEQVVEMGRTPHRSRLDWDADLDPVDAALARTEAEGLRDRLVDELSGGERQRVVLARALAQETPALLLDEPTASLDINHQVRVLELVRNIVADGRAAVAAIHDLDLAARYCDRLVLLSDGAVAASGPSREVLDDPALGTAFDTDTAVTENPVTGTPHVAAVTRRPDRGVAVHVVGHGPSAARTLGRLWEAGFDVSVGVVPEGDVAARAAAELGAEAVTSPPFSAPSEVATERAAGLLADAAVCLRLGDATLPTGGRTIPRSTPVVTLDAGGQTGPDGVVDAVLEGLERQPVTADD